MFALSKLEMVVKTWKVLSSVATKQKIKIKFRFKRVKLFYQKLGHGVARV